MTGGGSRIRCIEPKVRQTPNGRVMTRCMKCLGCRLRYKMSWTGRLLLEAQSWPWSRVLTLTYATDQDRFAPLNYDHVKAFLKRYGYYARKLDPRYKQRFFCVGEYGEESGHAHWHIAMFGQRSLQPDWMVKALYIDLPGWTDYHGFATDMQLNARTGAYICGYTLKKAQNDKPFARMSLNPAIAFPAVDQKAREVFKKMGSRPCPVPSFLGVNGKEYPVSDGLRRHWIAYYESLGGKCVVRDPAEMNDDAAMHIRFYLGSDDQARVAGLRDYQERVRIHGKALPSVRRKAI